MPIKTFSEKAALAEYAGFPDIDSYDERRANKRCFKPYFEKFCENVICPYLQSPDFDPQEIKKRMPSLNEVDAHLTLKNKRPPRYHQMERDMDKTNWLLIDHYACAVFQIRGANVMFPEGIFFNKEEMLREDRHYIIWALLRHEIDELLRPENGEGREKILKAVEEQQNGGEDEARELEAMIREFGASELDLSIPLPSHPFSGSY